MAYVSLVMHRAPAAAVHDRDEGCVPFFLIPPAVSHAPKPETQQKAAFWHAALF